MYAKMLKVLEYITEIMLSRIFRRWVHFRRILQIFGGLGVYIWRCNLSLNSLNYLTIPTALSLY